MVQSKLAVSVLSRRRTPTPIVPTLVIGVGKFGREVAIQLAARLLLTEDGLRPQGLKRSLLVQTDEHGKDTPGFVRVMELNWNWWMGTGYLPEAFLTDIDISGASVAEKGTPPQQREEDMLPDDQNDALAELPKMMARLFAVSEPLRLHDAPIQTGTFLTLGTDQTFKLRVIVVCAAREPATNVLLPKLLDMLGQAYVASSPLARGIEVFCYAGATSREEHRQAHGDDREYDQFYEQELARILPHARRGSLAAAVTGNSLLDQLEAIWHTSPPLTSGSNSGQTIEACYVIDTQLANLVTAVQLRDDEPDETIVATALALTVFITSDADAAIRRTRSRRWGVSKAFVRTEQGLFTSFGVGAYSLDHPRLRRLVYNYVTGMFLQRTQPEMYGDQGRKRGLLAGRQDDELTKDELEDLLHKRLQSILSDCQQKIAADAIERKMSSKAGTDDKKTLNYRKAIRVLERIDARERQKIKDELERLTAHMATTVSESALQLRMQKRQQLYQQHLSEASLQLQNDILDAEGPMVQLYRFLTRSLELLREEARRADAPPAGPSLVAERRNFAAEKSRLYHEEVVRRVDGIKRELRVQPNPIGAAGRALALAPLVVLLFMALSPLWNGISALFGNFLMALPLWSVTLLWAVLLWFAIFWGHRIGYQKRIGKHLQHLVQRYEALLLEADLGAWRWALAETIAERESLTERVKMLSRPGGLLPTLRDELLAEQFTAREQLLERIFFDETLQRNLKEISQQLIEKDHLWRQRRVLFDDLIHGPLLDKDDVKEWLRTEAERVYANDSHLITDLVGNFLKYQTEQRLEEMWHDLSTVAVPFLRHTQLSQDDPTIPMELFGLHGLQGLPGLQTVMRHSGVEVLNSADRLRWIFLRARVGMHLESAKFAIEAQIP